MYLCVDIGGTKTLVALFSEHGRVLRKVKFKTAASFDEFKDNLAYTLEEFRNRSLRVVTVAIPGVVQKNCSVCFGNRDWGEVDLYSLMSELFPCPVFFENDANLAAAYESYRLPDKTIFLTFSTGIGGGIASRGKILPESSTFEPGHKIYTIDGLTLEWEDLAAASALEKHFGVDYATNIRGKAELKEVARRVALGLPDIISEYKPDNIVLGGPLGKIFKLYVKYLPKLGVKYRRPRRPLESVIYGCYLYSRNKAR